MNPDLSNLSRSVKGDILIVDDSPDNLRVLSTTLVEQGYNVRCVKSGAMALIGVQTAPPTLILLDIWMPNMNGYEVCQRLKADPDTRDIPVIFLSALDDTADKLKAFEVGGVDYITKPFQTEEVLARVEHQLMIYHLQAQLMQQNQRLQEEIEEKRKVEDDLRQEIYHRTLIETALQDAKELAEAGNYARSEFLSKVSHELRTPLNIILGFTDLIKNDASLTNQNQEYIEIIRRSSETLLKAINNILTVTKAEASKLALNEHCFDLHTMLKTLETFWQPRAVIKGLQLSVECKSPIPHYVCADESKLRQILANLLDNAVKFTDAGQIHLRIGVEQQNWTKRIESGQDSHAISQCLSSLPDLLCFEVEDSGSGIDSTEIVHLFNLFSQTEIGRKSEQGLGLGLSISRQFLRLMGGDITVESQLGQGTLVRFYIPITPASALDIASLPPANSLAETAHMLADLVVPLNSYLHHGGHELTAEALAAAMPHEWIMRLHEAAIRGFDLVILRLVQEIPPSHAAIATILSNWSRNFQFDKILELTQGLIQMYPSGLPYSGATSHARPNSNSAIEVDPTVALNLSSNPLPPPLDTACLDTVC